MFYSNQIKRLEKQMSALTDKISELTKQVAANSTVTSALITHFNTQAASQPAVDTSAEEAAVQSAIDGLVANQMIMHSSMPSPPPAAGWTATVNPPTVIPVAVAPFA